ncbi:putative nonribosomal peptide synthase [Lophiostoma macrostomum CBS 122681]|uniref:Putative nonribosomal peptide synthase n=1 Tax=Lophiostoma macrostomum CBS 122681 TaxID=1314788 RepID=A0A6A6T997_9PLEO|nr:putative nonribosomal peptide synthase [Lophiostoma macrostomum CBS 122681]
MTSQQPGPHDSSLLDHTILDLFDSWALREPTRVVAEWRGQTLTYGALRIASLHVGGALLSVGVPAHSRIPLLTRMSLEMLPAIIGILRVGASYTPIDVATWSATRIQSTLTDLEATVAVSTASGPELELPIVTVNFQKHWLHDSWNVTNELQQELRTRKMGIRWDDLAWILFTSGTTGKPKGVMVYHRSAYTYASFGLFGPALPLAESSFLLPFSPGFDACTAIMWVTITHGRSLKLASGPGFAEVGLTCDVLVLTPSMLAMLDPDAQWITPTRKVYTTYGPTETTCNMSIGELSPHEEITIGHCMPGFRIALVDDKLAELDGAATGEALILGPGVAAGYLKRPELTDQKYIQCQGERCYRSGDLLRRRDDGQLVFAGRVDSVVKNRGFMVNLQAEVEPALLSHPLVRVAVALKWRDKIAAYVQPASVDSEELRLFLHQHFDSFVVPDEIFALDNFPLNANSKVDREKLKLQRDELATKSDDVSLGTNSMNGAATPLDKLRIAWASSLHVHPDAINIKSSFTSLGGNSLTGIRASSLLRKAGYKISAHQLLKFDRAGAIVAYLDASGVNAPEESQAVTATSIPTPPSQRAFINRGLESPISCALIGISEWVGAASTAPTPTELHDAFIKACSAHSIFQLKFNLTDQTAVPLGRLSLDWIEITTSERHYKQACISAEEDAWHAMNLIDRKSAELPYFQVTCISVPERKALTYIWRIHHALMDPIAQALLAHDIDLALEGQPILPRPRFEDFAYFMRTHELENLPRAIKLFGGMAATIPASWKLQLPKPNPTPPATPLLRFDTPLSLSRADLTAAARRFGITSSSMVYAAWSLFLRQVTGFTRVAFSIDLAGRTLPWPGAQDLVACLVGNAPFSVSVDPAVSVRAWLRSVHAVTLDVLEFDGLTPTLPDIIRRDHRFGTSNVLSFLDILPPPRKNWKYTEKQRHGQPLVWYVLPDGEDVVTWMEIQSSMIDSAWARTAAIEAAKMLEKIAGAEDETLVGELF